MKFTLAKATCIASLFLLMLAPTVGAGTFVPGDLKPGDLYHLAFVTSGKTTAIVSTIEYYNAFVSNQASVAGAITQGYGLKWSALASTPIVDARQNVAIAGLVYLLSGLLVAEDGTDLWDGSLQMPIYLDQFGKPLVDLVWTGTRPDGTANQPYSLGEANLRPDSLATFGSSTSRTASWTRSENFQQSIRLSVYAVSQPLRVPTVPEPNAAVLWIGVAFAVGCAHRFRNRSLSRVVAPK